jgi:hypothetical protein
MPRLVLLIGLFLPTLALAQSGTLTTSTGATTTTGSCTSGATLTVVWTTTGVTGIACQDLVVWGTTDSSCGSSPPDGGAITTTPTPIDITQTTTSPQFTIPYSSLPGLSAADCASDAGVDVTVLVCAQEVVASVNCSVGQSTVNFSPLTVTLNTTPPVAPVIAYVDALDSKLIVHMQTGQTNVSSSVVYFWVADGGAPSSAQTAASGNTPYDVTITGLTNGVTYDVQSYFVGSAPAYLAGPFSNIASGTPEPITGFWSTFVSDGGKGGGGCATASGLGLFALPVVGLWLLRRRRS